MHPSCCWDRGKPIVRFLPRIIVLAAWAGLLSGCAALTNPVANGIPVRRLPPELLGEPKEGARPLPLSLLRQQPAEPYRLGPNDVLGLWIEGVLGERNQIPPVNFPEARNLPPAVGFPIAIRSDGTVALPFVAPVPLSGKSIEEAEVAIRDAYRKGQILQPGRERVLVSLLRRRTELILVFREDAGAAGAPSGGAGTTTRSFGVTFGPGGTGGSLKRGAGFAVDLPAYENDVLHALALTGGLPGLDAVNEVVIQRGYFQDAAQRDAVLSQMHGLPAGCTPQAALAGSGGRMVRIPLRYRAGNVPQIDPEAIVLHTGDIVYIEAREADYFYTGGLLPPGQFAIPRDYDLDILQAITLVGGPVVSGGLNPINLAGTFVVNGIGFPSPSLVSIVRRTPGGGQVAIRVDLNRALRDPRERILIQPRDVLVLQETPTEAFSRYFTTVFKFTFNWLAIHGPHESGSTNVVVP
ncbi:MAG TPA: polysaccharide biosynthesis/export family protein [Gemmataceae bacterium]|nr:polysaccharide biosynthesis/export family protein [Gemmataceae bacterium]